jgi:thymidylate synthase
MFRVFEGQTADEVWRQVAGAFRNSEGAVQPSRNGQMREILHSALSIAEPTQRWVTSRMPPINPAFAIAEVIWIMTGRNDSAFLNYFNRQLPKYAGLGETYHGAYGHRLRHNLKMDQLDRAYQALKGKPSSRQVVLQIWDGRIDLPDPSGREASADIPCNLVSILKVRAGKLEWMQIMRSNDVYRGLPYNIVQFTTLQEVLAGWLGLQLGEYNQISNSLHVYEPDLEHMNVVQEQPAVVNTDLLAFSKKECDKSFQTLAYNIELIIDQNTSAKQLMSTLRGSDLSQSFRNMLCVLCAEGARRRRQQDIVNVLMSECTNPVYTYLYDQWLLRCRKQGSPTVAGISL